LADTDPAAVVCDGKKTKAFECLEKANEKGFEGREGTETDKDLEALRGDLR
jgi:hypothetical protein